MMSISINDNQFLFLLMVFIAVFLLIQTLAIRSVDQKAAKQLRRRMKGIAESYNDTVSASLLKEKYQRKLSPFQQKLELLPGVPALRRVIEQSGRTGVTVQGFILISLVFVAVGSTVAWMVHRSPVSTLLAGLVAGALPFIKINRERNKRVGLFEEQLAEAVDVMVRALRAGYPFNEALRAVSEEMGEPISKEFEIMFSDINYGVDIRLAFLNLLERMPSMTLLSVVTAVLIQRETGGNLAETLEKISTVIRDRFRFQRKVRTLSAEARMSAWILALMPFVLGVLLFIIQPQYMTMLIDNPNGVKVLGVAFALMVVGLLWIRQMIKKVMDI